MVHPNFGPEVLTKLGIVGSAFTIVLFLVVFQYTINMDFACPCDPNENITFCFIYLLLPAVILLFILILIDKKIKKSCAGCCEGYSCPCPRSCPCSCPCPRSVKCYRCRSHSCKIENCKLVLQFFKIITLASLWIIAVFVDGDWYLCYKTTGTNITAWHEQIPCIDIKSLTTEEAKEKRRYVKESRVIGIVTLCFVCVCWTICSYSCGACKPYYQNLSEEIEEEEFNTFWEKKLQEDAVKRIKGPCEEHFQNIQSSRAELYNARTESEKSLMETEVQNKWHEISNPMQHQLILHSVEPT